MLTLGQKQAAGLQRVVAAGESLPRFFGNACSKYNSKARSRFLLLQEWRVLMQFMNDHQIRIRPQAAHLDRQTARSEQRMCGSALEAKSQQGPANRQSQKCMNGHLRRGLHVVEGMQMHLTKVQLFGDHEYACSCKSMRFFLKAFLSENCIKD